MYFYRMTRQGGSTEDFQIVEIWVRICKGPEVNISIMCFRDSEKTSEAGLWTSLGDKVRT